MFKTGIVAFAICAVAVGTAFWIKTGFGAKSAGLVLTTIPSIQELYDKARLQELPVQEVRDRYLPHTPRPNDNIFTQSLIQPWRLSSVLDARARPP
jgi:hypothetical protein